MGFEASVEPVVLAARHQHLQAYGKWLECRLREQGIAIVSSWGAP